jgi:hypothetical protein
MDPTFQDTRECQLAAKLLQVCPVLMLQPKSRQIIAQAIEEADADAFTTHVAEFDR